jgi:hypothetical protein
MGDWRETTARCCRVLGIEVAQSNPKAAKHSRGDASESVFEEFSPRTLVTGVRPRQFTSESTADIPRTLSEQCHFSTRDEILKAAQIAWSDAATARGVWSELESAVLIARGYTFWLTASRTR